MWCLRLRNGLFRRSPIRVPCVCVGNAASGGTGKTPAVIYLVGLVHALTGDARSVWVVARGYAHDERVLLREVLRDAHLLVLGKNRRTAVQRALERVAPHEHPQLLIMDDGLQHFGMSRDMNICMIDAMRPRGLNGWLLPAGSLREPIGRAAARSELIVLHNANLVSSRRIAAISRYLRRRGVCARITTSRVEVDSLMEATPGQPHAVLRPLKEVPSLGAEVKRITRDPSATSVTSPEDATRVCHRMRVALLCAIGNADAFTMLVRRCVRFCDVTFVQQFPDHHAFSARELESLATRCADNRCDAVLTTEKDWSRDAQGLFETLTRVQPKSNAQPRLRVWVLKTRFAPDEPGAFRELLVQIGIRDSLAPVDTRTTDNPIVR
ncbi:putative tetraacyldisaccharide 4'-kinase, mitochondrial [Porphyridium purpureum]|uniref:tetraacyldisaccharide 4'-kinase n=1 Tax=Porphyridium purpureum TaxID=35688 RepID=A0A5J4Z7I0_PORPP|nr:putative tetraacyldisaccharide 4'-kinase, mitochondrial [Porphyridium purpureum]|eukprot:POR3322..scf295_1